MLVNTTKRPTLRSNFNTDTKVVFCELVEHPGGHDGGEFPQYHEFELSADVKGINPNLVLYTTDKPESPNGTFEDEEFVATLADDAQEALAFLKSELEDLERNRERLQLLVARLEGGAKFEQVLLCDEEDCDEDD